MYSEDEQQGPPTALEIYLNIGKKIVTGIVTVGICSGLLYMIWKSAGESGPAGGAVYGLAQGAIFLVCVWGGFIIGYFSSRNKGDR